MASARCVYCDATLQPNSMYCVECGQLIPQQPARPPVPSQFAAPHREAPVAQPTPTPGVAAGPVAPVPLPRTLPWQQPGSRSDASAPAAAAPAASPAVERVELAFSTGQRVVVSGSAVIGRKPADTALAMGARSVEVQDDTRSVSRVHLFLDVADGRILIGDAGSANGARLERGGRMLPLESAGTRVEAAIGDTVWLGDLAFQIRPA
ncbi:FHA domain-containing protein [Agromyces sp. CFH 90414]|uniref:FHA domain-containing protein n=1 Tax=Agromyces agglutinans TaxID=2662258 RepID=A0A6I2FC19_9MICO|nr:FHA domain-containing protein [Agromyces agglutinans]MRG61347.1 FHA domain-containing protein [Agromyces agglutinans]